MNTLGYILIFNFLGSLVSLSGGIFLLLKRNSTYKISHLLSSFAAGTLLGTVFFDLLPESLEEAGKHPEQVFLWLLGGILFFFILERLIHWFHHHEYNESEIKGKPVIPLIMIGDTIHNFIDGIAIAATFMANIPLGIVTTFAVGAHEIPQEIGDFGIMIKKGMSSKKTLMFNVLSAAASFVGALFAFYLGDKIQGISLIFLSISSGFFLYIALSDLIPEIHHQNKKGLAFSETASLLLGVVTVYLAMYSIENVLHIKP